MTNRYLARDRAVKEEKRTAKINTPVVPPLDVAAIQRDVLADHANKVFRAPESFKRRKTDDQGSVTMAFAKHVYGKFKTPYHLDRIWYSRCNTAGDAQQNAAYGYGAYRMRPSRLNPFEVLAEKERKRRISWYVCVATGGSLHKVHCKDFFTKKETHAFINAPGRLTFVEALWYAVASSYTDVHGLRMRVMRSKVARPEVTPFWKDAARFFVEHDIPLNEINDFCDFFDNRLGLDRNYSLRGRTPQSLERARKEWHTTLSRVKNHGGGEWEGVALPDYVPMPWMDTHLPSLSEQIELAQISASSERWVIRQIRTGDELAEEGARMHHCVYSYKGSCMSGHSSIWTMRRNNKRMLTIEMNNQADIVQIRGYANRLATQEEMKMINQWARDAGVSVTRRGY